MLFNDVFEASMQVFCIVNYGFSNSDCATVFGRVLPHFHMLHRQREAQLLQKALWSDEKLLRLPE
jgi:hypothetical protein